MTYKEMTKKGLNIADQKISTYPTRNALESHLADNPLLNKTILIKGSHGIGLEHIIKML